MCRSIRLLIVLILATALVSQAIALHTHGTWEKQKVNSIADVDRLTESTKTKFWGGRDIPAPILVDRGEETADLWGIGAIPNVMLIDPSGVLVKTQDPYGYLERELARSP